uniref:Uncharacterized protein n=1 Tax=Anguilla anguilla TaxID=7936 RepID=A0A0E9PM86_ANGAN
MVSHVAPFNDPALLVSIQLPFLCSTCCHPDSFKDRKLTLHHSSVKVGRYWQMYLLRNMLVALH